MKNLVIKEEHELVKRIRECDAFIPELSIVAVDEEIVGHIMLSKIKDRTRRNFCRIISTRTSFSC